MLEKAPDVEKGNAFNVSPWRRELERPMCSPWSYFERLVTVPYNFQIRFLEV